MKIILTLIGAGLFVSVFAQNPIFGDGLTIAGASAADTSRISAFQNPSAMAFSQSSVLSFGLNDRYIITELALKSCVLVLALKYFNFSLNFQHQGFSIYHQMTAGTAFSRPFGNTLALGAQLNYHSIYQPDNKMYHHQWLWQGGLIYFPSAKWTLAFHTFNPGLARFHGSDELTIPSLYSLAARVQLSKETAMYLMLSQSGKPAGGVGWEYSFTKEFKLGTGILVSEFLIPQMNFHKAAGKLVFDFLLGVHPLLGLQPSGFISYKF